MRVLSSLLVLLSHSVGDFLTCLGFPKIFRCVGGSSAPERSFESQVMVYVKIHTTSDISQDFNEVVAVCDEELLGRVFREGDVVLHINEEFFKGFLVTLDEAMHHARNAPVVVLVGEASVSRALKEGLVHPDAILRVSGVPYAQVIKL